MKKSRFGAAALLAGTLLAASCTAGTIEHPFIGGFDSVDEIGDVLYGGDPHADIDLWGVRYTATKVELYAKHRVLYNPLVDPNWTNANLGSTLVWRVSTNLTDAASFRVSVRPDAAGMLAVSVMNTATYFTVPCGTIEQNALQEIAVSLDPTACFGGTGPLRFQLESAYQGPQAILSGDTAPSASGAWSGWVVPA